MLNAKYIFIYIFSFQFSNIHSTLAFDHSGQNDHSNDNLNGQSRAKDLNLYDIRGFQAPK